MPLEYEEPRWTTLNVISYEQSKQNANQWQIKGRWEWTPSANKWGITTWADKSICPPVIEVGFHQVLVERGGVIKKQDDTYHDGTQDWMYLWRIIQWGDTGTPPATQPAPMNYSAQASQQRQAPAQPPVYQTPPQPAPQTQPQPVPVSNSDWKAGITNVTENEIRIMRQTALKCASWQIVPFAKDFAQPDMMPQRTIELAEMYLEYFVTGNMFQSIPAPEEMVEEDFGTF